MELNENDLLTIPSNFCRHFFSIEPYPWQSEVMDAVAFGDKPVSLLAANESGKTTVVAATLVFWHCLTFPDSKVVTTAGVYRQVREQLWPALKKFSHLFSGCEINVTDANFSNGARAVGFSTDEAGKFEGFHGKNFVDEPLLIIVDEAKSVPRGIFEAIERCRPQRLLIMSSAGGTSGEFYESHSKKKSFYQTFKITAADCPHLGGDVVKKTIDKYGENHPLVRSMIFSEFVDEAEATTVFTRSALEICLRSSQAHQPGIKTVFIDFGAGAAETVICCINGNKVDRLIAWRDQNTMSTVGRIIVELKGLGVSASQVWGDEGGPGKPMIDALGEAGWNIHRVNNEAAAMSDSNFANLGAEMWYLTKAAIEKNKIILLDDEVLFDQLINRRVVYTSRGKLGLETKEVMRARGAVSPDRADAFCGAVAMQQLGARFNSLNRNQAVVNFLRDLHQGDDGFNRRTHGAGY